MSVFPPIPTPPPPAETAREKLWAIAKGAFIAALGALLTYLASPAFLADAATIDPRLYLLATIMPVLVNAVRKFFPDLFAPTPPAPPPLPPSAVLVLLLALTLPAVGCLGVHYHSGTPAKAKVSGTTKAAVGGFVRLSSAESTGDLSRWTYPAALEVQEFDGGKTLAGVARGIGSATVTLEVLSIYDGRLQRDTATTIVVVDDGGPLPPGPTPPVPPAPASTLAAIARSQAVALVTSSNRKAEGVQVAGVFRSVATGVEARSINVGNDAVAAVSSRMEEALGPANTSWRQWFLAIQGRLNEVCVDGPSLAKGLRDVAEGVGGL